MSPSAFTASPAQHRSGRGTRSAPLLPPSTLAGFIIAILAVASIALFTYRALLSQSAAATRMTQTLDTIQQLEALKSNVVDAETGQRGFLLTGEESYLEPYTTGRTALSGAFTALRRQFQGDTQQLRRTDALEQLATERMAIIAETISLRRAGDTAGALSVVRSDRGKTAMEGIRALVAEMETSEREVLAARQDEWQQSVDFSSQITWGGSVLLLVLISAAAVTTSGQYRARETEMWVRAGQADLAERLQGEQRLETLGEKVLEFLARYLHAHVGALYIRGSDANFRRFGAYAMPPDGDNPIRPGDGLLGQAAKENRPLRVTDVPEGYLSVASSLGRSRPSEIIVAPAAADGVVHAVVELGLFHRVIPADLELLARVSESLAIAVRASKDRTRLEELLHETQRQAEELQAQQEELRVVNEELEEQATALKESQARLETQQADLEQTNSHLEAHAQLLEAQKEQVLRSQMALREKAEELTRANQYKSEFLANMSHELRTPLNSSLILAKLLADNKAGNLTNEQVKFAQTISSANNDLLALINDILDLSKIEAGKVEVNVEPVVIERAVDALAKSFQEAAAEKKLGFEVIIDSSAPDRIDTDPQRLGQILKNLLSNALKFTEAGTLSLTVSASDGAIRFAVRDTGIGIPSQQLGIIFEAFRQADGSTHRKYGGTGLGLSISRDLARLLGGEILVQSEPGKGSTFTLQLPLAFAGPQTAAPPPATPPMVHEPRRETVSRAVAQPPAAIDIDDDRERLTTASRCILVVEDDPRFAEILRDLAHELGFQCVITHTAHDGLAAATQYRPSAILLDVNLPDHSGLGVLDQLKRDPATRHIPVHVASVTDFTHEALERGAIGYVLKPVKREQLIEAFRQLEAKFSQGLRQVLVVEDDERQRESIRQLLANDNVRIIAVETAGEALDQLKSVTFDCMVMDLNLPDMSGYQLLETMAGHEGVSFPPVIVYTGRSLSADEEQHLHRFSKSIIVKDAHSPERLLDEVTLFLHQVESALPVERQRMLQLARDRDTTLAGRRILIVEDDARNIFALSSVLEPKGVTLDIARNGREALAALTRSTSSARPTIDLVLMDIMMPEMDGLTAMREIRKRSEWKKLPIIALTAKAMKDDYEKCLSAGANDYIAKPLDVDRLLSLVRVWMPK